MVLHGHFENGEFVVDGPTPLPEGAEVRIEILRPVQTRLESEPPTLRERLLGLAGMATGLPDGAARNHDDDLYT